MTDGYKDCFVGILRGSAFSNLQILQVFPQSGPVYEQERSIYTGLLCGDTYWICIFEFADPISVPTKRCLYVRESSIYKDRFVGTLIGSAFLKLQIQ